MKKLFILILFASNIFLTRANKIDEETAKTVGQFFLMGQKKFSSFKDEFHLELSYKATSSNINIPSSDPIITCFYVFNSQNNAFVIVSGDDNITPILAYSEEGEFDTNNIAPYVIEWLDAYKKRISYLLENIVEPTEEIRLQWKMFKNNSYSSSPASQKKMNEVAPLLSTKWGQTGYYNTLCPYDYVAGKRTPRTPTGCVATAMAQIMKFWNYPLKGSGFSSYVTQTNGKLAANYGGTTYQWASMPDMATVPDNSIATLMYHCGVSVEMDYKINASSSNVFPLTNSVCAQNSYVQYFNYDLNTLQGLQRFNFTDSAWTDLLKKELDAGRPLQYRGNSNANKSGHTWVCDGYDANNYFHMNWGWEGNGNGYFLLNGLSYSGGPNLNSFDFNLQQGVLIGIQPSQNRKELTLANHISLPDTINYGETIIISTNVFNKNKDTLISDYCAAIFDTCDNLFGYIPPLKKLSLAGNDSFPNGLFLSGFVDLMPGKYRAEILYKPINGQWKEVSDSGSFINLIDFIVIHKNTIQLNKAMNVISCSGFVSINHPLSVLLSIENKDTSSFSGDLNLSLYDFYGNKIEVIQEITNVNILSDSSKNFTFVDSNVNCSIGSYLLVLNCKKNDGNWSLINTYNAFGNPVKVVVQEDQNILQNDAFEPNNNFGQAKELPVVFLSGNKTKVKTNNSNISYEADHDYYKISLASGYNYTISPKLFDSPNSNKYAVNACFSYSIDEGKSWSAIYDEIIPDSITLNGNGNVYLVVSRSSESSLCESLGSYLLDISVNRELFTGIKNNPWENMIKIYPNPLSGNDLNIDLSNVSETLNQISISNMQGQEVLLISNPDRKKLIQFPINKIPNGIYSIRLMTEVGVFTKSIVILN